MMVTRYFLIILNVIFKGWIHLSHYVGGITDGTKTKCHRDAAGGKGTEGEPIGPLR